MNESSIHTDYTVRKCEMYNGENPLASLVNIIFLILEILVFSGGFHILALKTTRSHPTEVALECLHIEEV